MNKTNNQKFHMKKKIFTLFFCFFINTNHSIGNSSQKNHKIQETQESQKAEKIKKNNEIDNNFNLEKNLNIQPEDNQAKRSENEVKEIFEVPTILGGLGDNYGR